MQCMAIEFARNVLGYTDANSREMDEKTPHNVIDIMEEQKAITNICLLYTSHSDINDIRTILTNFQNRCHR